MTDKEKLEKIKSLADKMHDTAFNLTTDASLLKKAMDEYHQFIINEYHKEEQVIKELQEELVSNNYSVVLLPCIYNRTLEERVKYCKYCSAACEGRVKEPVNEELEIAANEWNAKASFTPFYMTLDDNGNPNGVRQDCTTHAESFKAGAKWQKEKNDEERVLTYKQGFEDCKEHINEVLLSEVLPCFMHGGEADEVVAKLDKVLNQKK